jgi:hypothetical protein
MADSMAQVVEHLLTTWPQKHQKTKHTPQTEPRLLGVTQAAEPEMVIPTWAVGRWEVGQAAQLSWTKQS